MIYNAHVYTYIYRCIYVCVCFALFLGQMKDRFSNCKHVYFEPVQDANFRAYDKDGVDYDDGHFTLLHIEHPCLEGADDGLSSHMTALPSGQLTSGQLSSASLMLLFTSSGDMLFTIISPECLFTLFTLCLDGS